MPRTPPVQIAGEQISERHVCVLHRKPGEPLAQVASFIAEGFDAGDRGFHLVEDAGVHRSWLRGQGLDTAALEETGQLAVREWTDPLRGRRPFDRPGMLEYVRHNLDAARTAGWSRTRWIATMEWATGAFADDADFVRFEVQLADLVRSRRDVIVCAFDLEHHSASVIASVIDAHALTLADGTLRATHPVVRASARERIVATAHDQFHNVGIRATGVDTLIEEAGVAKATFYRHFPSKDDLVVAWLRDDRPRWFDRGRDGAEAAARRPHGVVPLIFEGVARWLEDDGFRGCAFQNAAAEITDSTHPANPIIREYFEEIDACLREILTKHGRTDATDRAAELSVLLAGAIAASVAKHSVVPALAARDAAARLLAP